MSVSDSAKPYTVPKELNDPNGDIILRSSDQVEFRAFRWPLEHLYPVFSDMFHLNDPSTSPEPSTPPVVQMVETAPVIEALLRLSLPIDPPIVKDPRIIAPIIGAIVKLQAERRCRWWIRMTTEDMVPVNPWAMYAILLSFGRKSCDYRFEEEIRIAARETVGRKLIRPWEEASMISAADYDRLLEYHSDCRRRFLEAESEVLKNAGTSWPWIDGHCTWVRVDFGDCRCRVPSWFSDYIAKAREVFCKELRGEAIEDISLWYEMMSKKTSCDSCLKPAVLRMPAYTKALSRSMEEVVSQVTWPIHYYACSGADIGLLDNVENPMVNLPQDTGWTISYVSRTSLLPSLLIIRLSYRALYNRRNDFQIVGC